MRMTAREAQYDSGASKDSTESAGNNREAASHAGSRGTAEGVETHAAPGQEKGLYDEPVAAALEVLRPLTKCNGLAAPLLCLP